MRRTLYAALCAVSLAAQGGEWKMFDRRLGMFVHWGVYSVNGWHEQEEMRRRVPRSEYEKAAENFSAERFDAAAFVRAVETAPDVVADRSCFVTRRGGTVYCHYPKGLDRTGVNLRPIDRLPSACILLNTGAELACELEDMPSDYKAGCGKTLHVTGIPADQLAHEPVVIKLEFR